MTLFRIAEHMTSMVAERVCSDKRCITVGSFIGIKVGSECVFIQIVKGRKSFTLN